MQRTKGIRKTGFLRQPDIVEKCEGFVDCEGEHQQCEKASRVYHDEKRMCSPVDQMRRVTRISELTSRCM